MKEKLSNAIFELMIQKEAYCETHKGFTKAEVQPVLDAYNMAISVLETVKNWEWEDE